MAQGVWTCLQYIVVSAALRDETGHELEPQPRYLELILKAMLGCATAEG